MTPRRTGTRGVSLIEVMVASVVLILGLIGAVQLLVAGMKLHREETVRAMAQMHSGAASSNMAMLNYAQITAGSYDAGTVIDLDGRSYPRSQLITQIGDGGVGAFKVATTTEWRDQFNRPQRSTTVTIVSEKPDANY